MVEATPQVRGFVRVPFRIAFGLVLVLAASLRIVPAVDWEGGDAENYACIAWRMAEGEALAGTYSGPPHAPGETIGPRAFAIRPAVTVPTSWLLRAVPPEPWAFAAVPLFLGLSEVALAILFGRRLWGAKAGLLAGMLVACLPLAVSEARALRADLPAGVFLGWGVFALWTGMHGRTAMSRASLGIAAGLMFGLSWLAKETAVLAVPALATLAVIGVRRQGRAAWIALVACGIAGVSVLGGESAMYATRFGDPLFRFHELARNFEQCRVNFFYADSPAHGWADGGYAAALVRRIAVDGPRQVLFARPMLGLVALGIVGGIALWRRKDAAAIAVLAWLIALALAFNFGSTSLSEYRPVVLMSTYLHPLLLPACLLCGATAATYSGSRPVRMGFAAFMATAGLLSLAMNMRDLGTMASLRDIAAEVPDGARTAIDFRGTTAWSYVRDRIPEVGPDTVPFEAIEGPEEVEFVVVRDDIVEFLRWNYGYRTPEWIERLGQDGRTAAAGARGGIRLYRVTGNVGRP